MKTPPSNPEFSRFTAALRDVLRITPQDMERREATQKESGKRLSKGSACLDSVSSEVLQSAFAKR